MEYAIIINKKTNKKYKINLFKQYIIDQSVDIPADYFSFIVGNYNSEISNAISAGDEVNFYINNELVLNGLIDELDVILNTDTNDVEIIGRDKTSILLDNDAIPATLYNMDILTYLKKPSLLSEG